MCSPNVLQNTHLQAQNPFSLLSQGICRSDAPAILFLKLFNLLSPDKNSVNSFVNSENIHNKKVQYSLY